MTQPTISAERIEEMLAGLDGVTPGPWLWGARYVGIGDVMRGNYTPIAQTPDGMIAPDGEQWDINAAHIARCDPDTMREVLTLALSALRAQSVDQAENRAKIAQRKPISNEGLEAVANKEFGINDEDFAAELAIELLALRAQPQGSEAVAVWKHLPDGNNWLVVQPKFRGMEWPAEVPLFTSPPVQAQPQGCATEGCENQCVTNYEAGGVGSYYCEWCLQKVKALATPPAPVDVGVTGALSGIIAAWEATKPGDTTRTEIQRWLIEDMKPAIDYARAALTDSRAAVVQDETP